MARAARRDPQGSRRDPAAVTWPREPGLGASGAGAFVMPRKRERTRRRGQRDYTLPYQEWRFEVGAPDHGGRLDAFLAARLEWGSRTRVQRWIEEGAVELRPHKDPQQAPVGALGKGTKLRGGQEVVVRLDLPGGERDPEPPPGVDRDDLEILYEDEHLLAVNKPPLLAVHPSRGHLEGTLIHLVHDRHVRRHGATRDMPTLCHRLDRETSGLVLAAKDQLSRTRLGRQFEAKTVGKAYLALVEGEMEEDAGTVDLPLGKALGSPVRLKMGVRHDAGGQPSRTEWRVRRRLPGRTLVELVPRTGRQHQLRVHLAAIGHPIVGDKLYAGGDEVFIKSVQGGLDDAELEALGLHHQALHSWRLDFEHPFTGERMELEAPLWKTVAALAGHAVSG